MNWWSVSIAIVLSGGVHMALLWGESETREAQVQSPQISNVQTPDEGKAVAAFEALDLQREFDSAMDEVVAQIPEVDFSDIKLPEPEAPPKPEETPKPEPEKKPEKKVPEKPAATAESAKEEKPSPAPTPKPEAGAKQSGQSQSGANAAAQKAAKSQFHVQVRQAISKAIRVPRNVSGVQAVVAVRFQNGKLAGYSMQQSSGNAAFDQAVVTAVTKARYPRADAALPADVVFQIPLSIN